MAFLKKLTIAAALIAGVTSVALAQGQPTGNGSPGSGAVNSTNGMMNTKSGTTPSPAQESKQKDVSPASPAASAKQEK